MVSERVHRQMDGLLDRLFRTGGTYVRMSAITYHGVDIDPAQGVTGNSLCLWFSTPLMGGE